MLAYKYDEKTKEYTGTQIAQLNPLEGGYLLPANCTFGQPPTVEKEQVQVFENETWVIKIDHRGHYQVKLADKTTSIVNYIGDAETGYQFISDETYADFITDTEKYAVVDGVFKNIEDTEEYLNIVKGRKYDEANNGAKVFIDSGKALFEFKPTQHIEATGDNIGKFTAYALGFVTGTITESVEWTTHEDEVINLNQEDVSVILNGLGTIQSKIWTIKFPYYTKLIENAKTVEEVNAIVIDYNVTEEYILQHIEG